MNNAIEVKNLVKKYGDHLVLNGISFEVKKGEIFGLLGVNGAGKTTTLECVEGIRTFNDGSIDVNGKMGVQLQSSSLPKTIKGDEAVQLFARWNGNKLDLDILSKYGFEAIKNSQYKDLSTGQKRRLHLALAMIGDPDIIFLDEPTAGLDVEGRFSLHEVIRGLKKQGKTIIMASHDMAEVESLCDRIAILNHGEIAFIGNSNELTHTVGNHFNIQIKFSAPITALSVEYSDYLGESEGYSSFATSDVRNALFEILSYSKEEGNEILDIKIERATLEQKFLDIAKEVN